MRRLAVPLLLFSVLCAPAEAHWKWKCALALGLASPALWNAIDPPAELPPQQAAYERQLADGGAMHALATFLGPLRIEIGFLGRRMVGHSLASAAETTLRNDYGYALGYLGILWTLNGLGRRYFQIPSLEFRAALDAHLSAHPKKVVVLESFPRNSTHAYYQSKVFERLYGAHPNTFYFHFENLAQLTQLLDRVSQESDVDRLEVVFHGHPGVTSFADGSKATLEEFRAAFENKTFRLMAAGADIVLSSCSLAVRTPNDNAGERLVQFLGSKLLPQGGRVLAAAKNIVLGRRHPQMQPWMVAAMVHGFGLGNFEQLPMLFAVWRDYTDALHDAKVFTIAPTENN